MKKTASWICYDVETTGLDSTKDEILSIAIVTSDGQEIYSLVRPTHTHEWPAAEAINGITYEMTLDQPCINQVIETLAPYFKKADVIVGYNNIHFDNNFLKAAGLNITAKEQRDIMLEFAERYGEFDEKRQTWKWQKLTKAAEHIGYEFDAHNALEDIKATIKVMEWLDSESQLHEE